MNGGAPLIGDVDWWSIEHAHGSAGDIPDKIRALWLADQRARVEAYEYLAEVLCHQDSQYEATSEVIPFVIPLVADPGAPDRFRACYLLARLAVGSEVPWLRDPANLSNLRRDVERRSTMTVIDLERELEEWLSDAPTVSIRRWRALQAEWMDVEERRLGDLYALRSYDAAKHGVPVYVKALKSGDPTVRLAASYLLGWFPEESMTSLSHLKRMLVVETDTSLVATAAIATSLLAQTSDPELCETFTHLLSSPHVIQRWAGAIGLARHSSVVEPHAIQILYDCIRRAYQYRAPVPYLGGDMSALAVLVLPLLSHDAAPDRLDVLIDHLVHLPLSHAPDARLAGHAIVRIAFEHVLIPDGVKLTDLTEIQRKALTALFTSKASRNSVWWRDLAGEYGLPTNI